MHPVRPFWLLACWSVVVGLLLPACEPDPGCRADADCAATEFCERGTCIAATCGNGVAEPGEQCDDGDLNAPDAACLRTCRRAACGDGFVQAGIEDCDPGDDPACPNDCQLAICGNGRRNADEECDDGRDNNDEGACTTACLLPRCGDGFEQAGEACDTGADNDDAGPCTTQCQFPRCGDGLLQADEQCDDGNDNAADAACTDACQPARCGDGFRQAGVEPCDDGAANDDTAACRPGCIAARCGDGVVYAQLEDCDDGAANADGAACTSACRAAVCGDGLVFVGREGCDDGAANANTAACRANCVPNVCGDGFLLAGVEECDEGAANGPTAACLGTCRRNVCGDGSVRVGVEACDDGAANGPTAACLPDCSAPGCGDGLVQSGVEACDDGAANGPTATCLATCRRNVCGDGFVLAGIEECDEGAANGTNAHCLNTCKDNVCGDGFVDPVDEQCDDGNQTPLDGCSPACSRTLWSLDLGAALPSGAGPIALQVGSPVVDLVLYGTAAGDVIAVRVVDGTEAWRVAVGGAVVSVVSEGQDRFAVATAAGDVLAFDASPTAAAQRFRKNGVVIGQGAARLALQEGRIAAVTSNRALAFFDLAGNTPTLKTGGNATYTQTSTAAPLPSSATCNPCLAAIVTGDESARPGGVTVPMGNALVLWDIHTGCAPSTASLNANERVVGHVVVTHNRASVVTSEGDLVRFLYTGSCTPVASTRRLTQDFTTEPLAYETPSINDSTTYVVADAAGRVQSFRMDVRPDGSEEPVTNTPGWPAQLPSGRVVRVPPALDDNRGVVVVDNVGDVHGFSATGVRRFIGSTGAAPASGPLLVARAVVVATAAGRLVALEGGPVAPTYAGWLRDGGNAGGGASSLCAQASSSSWTALAVLALALRGRRRWSRPA